MGDIMKKVIALLCVLLTLTGCKKTTDSSLETFSNTTVSAGFDTYLSIRVATDSKEKFTEYFNQSVEKFSFYNELFDIYHTYPNINNFKTINDSAGIQAVEVDQDIIDLLLLAREFYKLSDGQFDITIGAVLKVWHSYRELDDGSIPTPEELDKAAGCVGWDFVEIDDEKNTVFINNPCVSLDVGGIAKGFAAEKIAQSFVEQNIKMGVVDAGGNNRTINDKLDGTPWRVGVQNPSGNGSLLIVSQAGSSSFVTSGDYQRFFVGDDGVRYHHIINPKTNYPATYFRSVTIITADSAIADTLSTLIFTLPYTEGLAFIEKYNQANPDYKASVIWILSPEQARDFPKAKKIQDYYYLNTSDIDSRITIPQ